MQAFTLGSRHMADEMSGGKLCPERLGEVRAGIADDIRQRRCRGASALVARGGRVGLHEAFGQHRSDDPRPIEKSSVFSLFSLTKGFTNVVVFRAIERGQLALTTKVSSVIPGFGGSPPENTPVSH